MMLVMLCPCWAVCIQTAKSSRGLPSYWCCAQTCPNIWPKPSQAAQVMLVMLWPCWAVCIQTFQELVRAPIILVMCSDLSKYLAKAFTISLNDAGDALARAPIILVMWSDLSKYLGKAFTTSPNDAGDVLALLGCLHSNCQELVRRLSSFW